MRSHLLLFLGLVLAACSPAASPAPAAPSSPPPSTTAAAASPAQPPPLDTALEPLRALVGTWRGADPDRHSTGQFTLAPELGGKVLVRRGYNDSPQGHHEDLTLMFSGPGGLRASYWDNEGHVIQYAVTASADRIEFLGDEAPRQPRFRLRYDLHKPDEIAIDFAVAMPGAAEFQHYTGGVVHRVSP